MNKPKTLIPALLLATAAYGLVHTRPKSRSVTRESVVARCGRAYDVVVRFYYNPMTNQPNLSPAPLIFLPVSSQDPRLDTRPAWVLYVTHPELRSVLGVLGRSNLGWKESSAPIRLVVDPFDLPAGHHDSMQAAVTCPSGSATAEVEAKQVCGLLSEVARNLSSPKAREAMSFYAGTVSCPLNASR